MRKILAIAALAGGLMIPLATPSAAVTVGLPCDSMSLEAGMCGMDYEIDLQMCDYAQPGQQSGCRSAAAGRFATCMNRC